jgi:nucleotide-binding universal stress UspA family protein
MNEKITVGYDGTESSIESVMWAAHEADLRRLPLRIISCFAMSALAGADPLGWGAGEAFETARTAADHELQEMLATATAVYPDVSITSELSPGPVGEALLEDVGQDDLVVVGASSHPGAAAFWLGSTPRHLVHRSPCAVVVVRGPASRGGPERVVVGIDGSPAAERALHWAADEADLHHVPLLVVHSWSAPAGHDAAVRDEARIDAACVLERAVDSARQRCGTAVDWVLEESGPVAGLVAAVRDGDHLVLGSRGRGAVRSGLFGSTVNGILDVAAVPVVVVREAPIDLSGSPSADDVELVGAT